MKNKRLKLFTNVSFGDEDFRLSGASFYSNLMDLSLILSLGPHVDVYCPPHKRSRISAPFILRSPQIEEEKRSSIDVLPDECLFEIFRRLPGAQERRSYSHVSKHWLMLQSSICRADVCSANDVVMSSPFEEAAEESESDGFLTRCLEGKKATDTRLATIVVGTSSCGGLGKLMVRGSNSTHEFTDLGLTALSRVCPSLKALSFWNVDSVIDANTAAAISFTQPRLPNKTSGILLIRDPTSGIPKIKGPTGGILQIRGHPSNGILKTSGPINGILNIKTSGPINGILKSKTSGCN